MQGLAYNFIIHVLVSWYIEHIKMTKGTVSILICYHATYMYQHYPAISIKLSQKAERRQPELCSR